jgi:hypothetical protein
MKGSAVKALWLLVVGAIAIELTHGLFAPELNALPQAPAGWKLAEHAELKLPSRKRPAWSGTSGALKAWRATYDGVPPMTLTLYQMPWSPGSAWDAIQKWRT